MSFVHLHNHSQYSILESSAAIEAMVEKAKKEGSSACALTDRGNLYGAVEFYKEAEGQKIKPIIGCELYLAPQSRLVKKKCPETDRASFPLTFLAKNSVGYRNLCKLSSIGFLEGFYYDPRIDLELLAKHAEGLICLTGNTQGRLAYEILKGSLDKAEGWIETLKGLFGEDLYLEVMSHPMTDEEIRLDGMKEEPWLYQSYLDFTEREKKVATHIFELSDKLKVSCVLTQDSHYIERDDWKSHEILLNIQSGEPTEIWERDSLGNLKRRLPNPKRRAFPSHGFHFKTVAEMGQLFPGRNDILEKTLEIADKCNLKLDFKTKHYPVYVPPNQETVVDCLWRLCREGIPKRYTPERLAKIKELFPDKDPLQIVEDRLAYEMGVIVPKEMSDYLLIVWDFIHWAKTKGIPVGPGRGSGAGSIVLYLIGVTDIEPLRFHLFFERFINPERISYPDIDVDICMERRGEVIHYTLEKYGKDNVAQIITFGTMKAKMAIKDVGRVLNVPLPKVNEIAKLIPEDLNITIDKALEKDPGLLALYESDEEARRVLDIAKKLEGSIRNTGVHAAGLVVSGQPLTDHIPIANAKDSDIPVTQFSMKPVEMVGMLKIDFLGLKTLTSIQMSVEAIKERTGREIDWVNLPLDDLKAFELLNQGKTLGIFQLESGGMQDLAKNLHLDKFEEIIAVTSLYRPGPMDMIPSFINRKHGKEPIEIDHPWMDEILKETYGIMVYQEQVMQMASKLANYSLGEGDILRRAMGKKELDKMAEQREKFRLGCLQNGIEEAISMTIFDKMEKFASYGFNKSHAAAYGYLTYVTAYLKSNYPMDWMAALMTCDSHDVSKIAKFIGECQAMGITLLTPDLNESNKNFFAAKEGIRFAMGGIKGLGEGVVEAIIEERKANGRFDSLHDFLKRMDFKKLGKKGVELLVDSGCFGFTGWTKDELRTSIDPLYESISKEKKESSLGFMNMFGGGDEPNPLFLNPPKVTKTTSVMEDLFKQKELLGFFLTGHPLDHYKDLLLRAGALPLNHPSEDATVYRSAFLVEEIKTRFASKSQKKFAILTVSDKEDRIELPVWPELYEKLGEHLFENKLYLGVIESSGSADDRRLSALWFQELSQVDEAALAECDREYDRGKSRQEFRKNLPKEKPQEKKVEEPAKNMGPIKIKGDLRRMRLSHILALKKLLRAHPGKRPVTFEFHVEGAEKASVEIPESWGVEATPALLEKIKALTFEVL